ncbi:hypothetical protein QLX08_009990 [Tetragonisca angustula]|uniref:Uncharacterized protein n=1 Tax=Tetragonisca angustula TaxID=166442 RepID=A0AAW0ZDT0_9HYME
MASFASGRIDRLRGPPSPPQQTRQRGGHFERACAVHSKQTMRNCPYFANARRTRIARALNDQLRASNAPMLIQHSPISRQNPQKGTSDHGNANTIYMYTGLE